MNANEPISVGVVGAGTIACNAHIPVLRAMPNVRLAWIADTLAERAANVAAANQTLGVALSADSADLPNADIVLLAIPLHVRRPYVEKVLERSSAVFAEKPFALNANEHRQFLALGPGWQLGCGYQRRFYSSTQLARRLIASKTFGNLRTLRMSEGARVTRAGAEGYIDKPVSAGGGLVKNLGCHSLDTAFQITGAEHFEILSHNVEWDAGTDRHAQATIHLQGNSAEALDCRLEWTVSWLEPQSNTVEAEFELATLKWSVAAGGEIELFSHTGERLSTLNSDKGARTINQSFYLEWAAMMQGYRARELSAVSAQSSLIVARVMDEILKI